MVYPDYSIHQKFFGSNKSETCNAFCEQPKIGKKGRFYHVILGQTIVAVIQDCVRSAEFVIKHVSKTSNLRHVRPVSSFFRFFFVCNLAVWKMAHDVKMPRYFRKLLMYTVIGINHFRHLLVCKFSCHRSNYWLAESTQLIMFTQI